MTLIRWQNLLFALLPGVDAARACWRASARQRSRARCDDTLAGSAAFLAARSSAFLPQMLAWQAIYGSLIARSPVGPQIRWTDPHLVDILWSARNGLFSTTPILYLGAIGLVVRASRGRLSACPRSPRSRDDLLQRLHPGLVGQRRIRRAPLRRRDPALRVGLAAFIDARRRLVRRHAAAAVIALLARDRGVEPGADGRGAGRRRSASAKRCRSIAPGRRRRASSMAGSAIRSPIPASLVFALRNGVSPGDYDLLSTNRFLARSAAAVRPRRRRRRDERRVAARRRLACAGDATARSRSGGRRPRRRCASRSTTRRRCACRCGSTPSPIRARRRRR